MLGPRVGLRADARYFRRLSDGGNNDVDLALGSFHFWRVTGGLVLKF